MFDFEDRKEKRDKVYCLVLQKVFNVLVIDRFFSGIQIINIFYRKRDYSSIS